MTVSIQDCIYRSPGKKKTSVAPDDEIVVRLVREGIADTDHAILMMRITRAAEQWKTTVTMTTVVAVPVLAGLAAIAIALLMTYIRDRGSIGVTLAALLVFLLAGCTLIYAVGDAKESREEVEKLTEWIRALEAARIVPTDVQEASDVSAPPLGGALIVAGLVAGWVLGRWRG